MPVRCAMVVFAFCIMIPAGLRGAYDPLIGTWKLNLQTPQTKFSPGYPVPKSQTFQFEASGADHVKFIGDTVDADGKPVHSEYVATLDGKDAAVKGDPNLDSVALQREIGRAHV